MPCKVRVDVNSIVGGYHGYQYNSIALGSGVETTCYQDEFELLNVADKHQMYGIGKEIVTSMSPSAMLATMNILFT